MTSDWIPTAADRIKNGKIGIIPCDTVWGICSLIRPESIHRIFEAKQRPKTKPFITLVNSRDMIELLCAPLNSDQLHLVQTSWPGPTTLILPKHPNIDLVSDTPSIGIRWPGARWLCELIDRVGEPILSTSANLHGFQGPLAPGHWPTALTTAVDFIVDDPMDMIGVPSTIIDGTVSPPRILRNP
ncbi:threonylcarbamoyl-AMP synthase [bacterium]|nr:threonylcarbamoyl-AMP synthase [bacterium]